MKNVINKNTILALMVIGMMCFWGSMNANAQQLNVQGDLVSSYVWRGMYQTGASIQPTLGFSVGNFSLPHGAPPILTELLLRQELPPRRSI